MIKPNNPRKFDAIIVGGGMVGMAAAITLSKLDLSVCLLESIESENNTHPSYDDRTLVVNQASIQFWKNIGVWQTLLNDITSINKVHVSNKGHFGSVNFDAKSLQVDALAYIVEAKKLGIALQDIIKSNDCIKTICPAKVTEFKTLDNQVEVSYHINENNYQVISKLMLAADGVKSSIRQKLGLETVVKSYDRTAIICNITPQFKHHNCAFERLTNTGPTALLPFVQNRCGFVWTVEQKRAEAILNLTDEEFLTKAQDQFGYRLGKFLKTGARSSYPLYLVTVPTQVKSRVILLGNAAHSMSPVSAQGLNLAVRDVAMLSDIIESAINNNQDIGSDATLNYYQKNIEFDQSQTMNYTDDLMNWFKIDEPIVATLRSLGLLTLDNNLIAKKAIFSRASGYRGKTPKLLKKATI
jgi:2-octaprenyl-6-methoxyphenol hydroxylase